MIPANFGSECCSVYFRVNTYAKNDSIHAKCSLLQDAAGCWYLKGHGELPVGELTIFLFVHNEEYGCNFHPAFDEKRF